MAAPQRGGGTAQAGPQVCLGAPLNRCGPGVEPASVKTFPDIRGKDVDEAVSLIARAGIDIDPSPARIDRRARAKLGAKPGGGKWGLMEVVAQSVPAGTPVSEGVATKLPVRLTVWGGPSSSACQTSSRELAGTDLETFRSVLGGLGCDVDDMLVQLRKSTTGKGESDLNSGDRCDVVTTARSSRKEIDATIAVPTDPRLTDLRVSIREFPGRPSLIADDNDSRAWTLPRGRGGDKVWFVVLVQTRSGALVNNAEVFVDASDVSGMKGVVALKTGSFAGFKSLSAGAAPVGIAARKPGRIEVVAFAAPASGGSACGSAQARVSDVDERYVTISGNTFRPDRDGGWELAPATAAETRLAARASGVGEFFNGLKEGFLRFFGLARADGAEPVAETVRKTSGSSQQQVKTVAKDAGVMQTSCGKPIDGAAEMAKSEIVPNGGFAVSGATVSALNARVIACDRNQIFGQAANGALVADPSLLLGADGASLIGADGASLIGADGASLVGADGATALPAPVDARTAKLVGLDSASLIGADGASLIGADGASLIGADGASLIGSDGATAIAANGSALVAAPGGNAVARGAGG